MLPPRPLPRWLFPNRRSMIQVLTHSHAFLHNISPPFGPSRPGSTCCIILEDPHLSTLPSFPSPSLSLYLLPDFCPFTLPPLSWLLYHLPSQSSIPYWYHPSIHSILWVCEIQVFCSTRVRYSCLPQEREGALWLLLVERSTGAGCLHLPLLLHTLPSSFPLAPFADSAIVLFTIRRKNSQ